MDINSNDMTSRNRSALFGNSDVFFGAPTANAVFAPSLQKSFEANDLIAKGLKRDLDRLNGFKVDLTPSEKKELDQLQERIGRIAQRADPNGVLSDADARERQKLYQKAYKIMGKDYVDVKSDSKLKELMAKVDTLLEPKLRGPQAARLKQLRKLEENMLGGYEKGKTSNARINQIRNIQTQIRELTPPRKMTELSNSEKADYNKLVNEINKRAGSKLLLNSRDRARAEQIEASMARFS